MIGLGGLERRSNAALVVSIRLDSVGNAVLVGAGGLTRRSTPEGAGGFDLRIKSTVSSTFVAGFLVDAKSLESAAALGVSVGGLAEAVAGFFVSLLEDAAAATSVSSLGTSQLSLPDVFCSPSLISITSLRFNSCKLID